MRDPDKMSSAFPLPCATDPLEDFPIGVYRSAADGTLLYANQALQRMLRFSSRQELLAAPVLGTYQHASDREAWLEEIEREGSVTQEIEIRCNDGASMWVLDSARAVRDELGETMYYEGALQDITQRKEALDALEKTRKRFQSMIENGSDMISIFDTDGRRTYVSPSMTRTLHEPEGDLIDQSVIEAIHPDDQAAATEFVRWLSTHPGETRPIEFRRRGKDGQWRLLSAVGKNLVDDPAVGGIVVNARDITEERELAEQVRRSHKMEAVGRLAGGIAHDFNNLLTVIGSCTDFVLSDAALPEEHRADLEELKKATERATSLTRQLLAFGRGQVLRPSTINLNDRLTDLLPMLKRLFESTISIEMETRASLWMVRADPGQIEQVLLNLALNARDAMPEGGTLTFATENIIVSDDRKPLGREYTIKSGEYVLLRVRDTGVGMDEATQRRIFEPFFTTKEVGKGTGLGLATAYGIVKQSGGYIRVRAVPGEGAEFLIYLPRTHHKPETIPTYEVQPTVFGSGRVLVVEDEPGVRSALQRILEAGGYTVLAAANGKEGLELFAKSEHPIDLLIADLVMPGMGGRELAKHCRDLHEVLKVLYVSGYTKDSLLSQQTFEDGIQFLEKPFTRDGVLERVTQVLAR